MTIRKIINALCSGNSIAFDLEEYERKYGVKK
jgi:hypothetical protein